jgi:hydrogenase maturation protease
MYYRYPVFSYELMKTLVLGLGNELYGDDAVGIHVIRKLREEFEKPEKTAEWLDDVELEECSLSGLALLEVIVDYDTLIIIDTLKKEKPLTGKIHLPEEKDLRHIPGPSPHYVSIPQSIELGKKLGLQVPSRIKIIAVEAKNQYNLGEGLTEEMTESIPAIVKEVKKVLQELA